MDAFFHRRQLALSAALAAWLLSFLIGLCVVDASMLPLELQQRPVEAYSNQISVKEVSALQWTVSIGHCWHQHVKFHAHVLFLRQQAIRQLNTTLYSSCASVDERCGGIMYTVCVPMPRSMFNGSLSAQESARDNMPFQAAASGYGQKTYEVEVRISYTVYAQPF